MAPTFGTCVLDESKILTISLALPPIASTTSLLSALNSFQADLLDNPVVFNIEISDVAILLKP